KFEDEKIIYAFVQAGIKHALAQFSVMPALDFDLDASIQQLPSIQQPFTDEKKSAAASTSLFKGFTQKHQAHFIEIDSSRSTVQTGRLQSWESEIPEPPPINSPVSMRDRFLISDDTELNQLLNTYIAVPSKNGFILIHQQCAHERVLYEKLKKASKTNPIASQQSLFPVTMELTPADTFVLEDLMDDLQQLGYSIEPFGKNTFVIRGTPADIEQGNEKHSIDLLLEQYKHFSNDLKFSKREKLIRSVAKQQAIKAGTRLTEREMRQLVTNLFACENPNSTPDGFASYLDFKEDDMEKIFGR
ncbi:MAG: DNA mismatch repair protein MutL, partial [Chitinophagaceae bacterium]